MQLQSKFEPIEIKLLLNLHALRYEDAVLVLNNSKFGDHIDHNYTIEPKINDTMYVCVLT